MEAKTENAFWSSFLTKKNEFAAAVVAEEVGVHGADSFTAEINEESFYYNSKAPCFFVPWSLPS